MINRNNNPYINNPNPYIIGKPIHDPGKFFGREDLFLFIEDNLNNNIQIQLLHGQRRIGKSSVLVQVPHKIQLENRENFVFVCFDLQMYSNSSVSDIIYKLAEKICEELNTSSDISIFNTVNNSNSEIFSDVFLPAVCQELGNKKLVLLLDESDVAISINDNIYNNFFQYLQTVLNQQRQLFIIPVLGRFNDDLENFFQLFGSPPSQKIDLFNYTSANRLIINPARGVLRYEQDAIKAIFQITSGHPCLIQYICFNLFGYVRSKQRSTVTCEDVKVIVEPTLENATLALDSLWDGLCIHEKVVFSAVAEAQKIAFQENKFVPKDPLIQLKKCGIVPTEELIQAAKQLARKDYLEGKEAKVKIEFIRRWLVRYKPLNTEIIFKLEEINKEEINQISERETELYRHGKTQDVIDHYEKILTLNPNYFTTIPVLAKKYLEIENFDEALKLYTRAYQADRNRNQEGLLLAREAYGKYLIKQGELIKAEVQFEKVLKIESDRKSAKDKLEEIKEKIKQQQLAIPQDILAIIAVIITIAGGSIILVIYQSLTYCSQDQEKVNNRCVPITKPSGTPERTPIVTPNDPIQSNISSGDRTLFFNIPNTYRDQGIEAFKQGNYPQAVQLFQQAITANPSDPEVRIYYNNAIARQRGNPFTLAVVVPADNGRDRALEILRGVSQSQEQFNVNGGRDGRSLEIVIANDGDDEKQAEQIAQYLVNKSVLGVIGHGSSQTTKLALDIYEQAGIPFISPTSSANTLQGNNFFRTTPSDAAFGEKLAQYAIDSRLNKVVIVYNSDKTYSNSLRKEFEQKFKEKFKGQIISLIDLNKKTLNIEQELKDSASQQVQAVILLPNVENIGAALDITKVNADNKLGLKLLGGDALYNPKTLKEGGNAVEGLVIAIPWFRDAPQARNFSQAAKQMWGGDISWRTATSYDAAQAFINSLSAQPSRETILQKLPQTDLSDKLTSGNNLKFQNGEPQNEAILVKVESGKFTCLKQCSP